jgi:carbamoyl-phosphate synthase small subunit
MKEKKKIKLILEDGHKFFGYLFGYPVSVSGELVFNTAMTGYPESLTDPSYKGQILVSTYPLIGNYGVPVSDTKNKMLAYYESNKIHVEALVISQYSEEYSHWNAEQSLHDWMVENKIPGIYGVDTRKITQLIREKGSMKAKIIVEEEVDFVDISQINLVEKVSIKEKVIYGNGLYKILLVDCGVKNNIIRRLLDKNATVIRVPWDYPFLEEDFDGLFISNGPGDPEQCKTTISNLNLALKGDHPIFGICLGHQLLSLASGAKTYKLKYGHRSHNQPVFYQPTRKAYITSQNHGYAVDESSLSKEWEPTFRNLNDDTNEGIRHLFKPVFSTQFHPEASGGPTDTDFLFDDFIEMVKIRKNAK